VSYHRSVRCVAALNLLNFGADAERSVLASSISRAEDLGFEMVMASDHVVITPDVDERYPAPFREPFTLLAWAAQRTELLLGTTVAVLPYRHPEVVASMVDTIERLSGRPFTLGVGMGWAAEEFARLGVPFAARGGVYQNGLAVLAAHRAAAADAPDANGVRSGHFRGDIWVGGNGARARRRAAEFGQAWHPLQVSPAQLAAGAAELAAAGHRVALAPRIKLRPGDHESDPDRRLGAGSWDQIVADLQLALSLGATHIVLDPDVPETRLGADPWPVLERALGLLRDLQPAET
jgi:alkanesulfonate monooxygenase SsuD/methylene tetrahydromethanopterin reductase-like flavin-dependent oxidoreductase (luciferase family)